MRFADDSGQAVVEVLWLVPVVGAVVLGLIGAGIQLASRSAAGAAAEAAAVAVLQQRDPVRAAQRAVPDWNHVALIEHGRSRVRVRVGPSLPVAGFSRVFSEEVSMRIERHAR